MRTRTIILLLLLTTTLTLALPGYENPKQGFSANTNIQIQDTAIYNKIYVSTDGSNWQERTLTGNTQRGNWIIEQATNNQELTGIRYVAIFSCSWSNGWNCGETWQVLDRGEQGQTHSIVTNGQATADIIVDENAPNMVKLAAEYFQSDIEDITGATLPIRNAPGDDYEFHVYIGSSQYTDALGITSEGTRYGGYKIVSGEDYLVLLGDDEPYDDSLEMSASEWEEHIAPDTWINPYPGSREYHRTLGIHNQDRRGSMNAIHDFLYEQGMRWYYPNHYGTITPQKTDISFEQYDKTVNSPFAMRDFMFYYKSYAHLDNSNRYPEDHEIERASDWLRWQHSLGENSAHPFLQRIAHGIDAIIEHPETQVNHPEYYAIWNGQLRNGQDGREQKPDLCSEELKEETIRYVKTIIDTYHVNYVNIMPTDGFTRASERTQECKNKETPERGGDGILSDYVWDFINDVAWAIADDPSYGSEYLVHSGAYSTYKLPPTEFTDSRGAAPNLAARLSVDRTHNTAPANWQRRKEIIHQWNEIIPGRIFMNDKFIKNWDDRKTTSTIPFFRARLISEDFKFLEGISSGGRHEVPTTSKDNQAWDHFAAQGHNVYVAAKMYWDPSTDIDELLDEYFELYYGPAENTMRELHEYAEANLPELHIHPQHRSHMRELLQEALTQTPDGSDYEKRVANLLRFLNGQYDGEEVEISSCQTLTSPGTTYKLTQDISTSKDNCIVFDHQGQTLDCQGHTITWSGDTAITDSDTNRGHYFTVRNCNIQEDSQSEGGQRAIQLGSLDYGEIQDVNITTHNARDGIRIGRTHSTTIRNTRVVSDRSGMYFARNTDMVLQDNYVQANTGRGITLHTNTNDLFENNEVISQENTALQMFDAVNATIRNNIFVSPVNTYSNSRGTNVLFENNTEKEE